VLSVPRLLAMSISQLKRILISFISRMTIETPSSSIQTNSVALNTYQLGFEGLSIGHKIAVHDQRNHNMDSAAFVKNSCHPPPGIYNSRQLVQISAPLLDSIVSRLGPDLPNQPSTRETLLQGLAASLSTSGRESTLPLSYGAKDTSRKEISWQASRIGKELVRYARETSRPVGTEPPPAIQLHSQCEGHLWTPEVASLLLGSRSHSQLMELYNEWLHRMILLRDALLPFENFHEVPFLIPNGSKRGLRDFEPTRKIFLLHCLSGMIPQTAIVDLAKGFTAPQLPSGGYGIQYSQGLILPAFLSGSPSLHLLRHHPARIDDSAIDVLFDYEYPVYRELRKEISKPEGHVPPGVWPPPALMALDPQVTQSAIGMSAGSDASRRLLRLELLVDSGVSVSVDIGQISRGRRYAYRPRPDVQSPQEKPNTTGSIVNEERSSDLSQVGSNSSVVSLSSETTNSSLSPSSPLQTTPFSSALFHETSKVFSQSGLLGCSESGQIHLFPATDPLIVLALLGKLYPENVVLIDEDESPDNATNAGKGFGSKLVVLQRGKRSKVSKKAANV
jgi:hypothetical protein